MTEIEIRERFFATRDALAMIEARTARVDQLVCDRWGRLPEVPSQNVALVATGGYGRGELFPCSDIDLLILTPDEKTQDAIREPLGLFLRDLWDSGLRLSQSVHTPKDCNQIEEGNAELAVSLLDRRFLAGDETLFQRIRDPRAELGRDIARLARERHSRYQGTIFHLEPNVKEAPGGMRDLQLLRWLSKLGVVGGDLPQSIVSQGIPVLFAIRCYLHYLAGRDENRLTFERQDEIALRTSASSPEELMRQYYRAVTGISRLAIRNIERCEAKRSSFLMNLRDQTSGLSNARFSVAHGKVHLRSVQALEADPGLLLPLFEFTAMHGLALATDAEEWIERNVGRFAAWVGTHQPVWPPFRDILRLPYAAATLRSMHATGVLEALFPELDAIKALVIRDFYHRYTVDEHTLVAIKAVSELVNKENDGFGDVARETEELDLLLTALLFHDVGKANALEGHVESSARIAERALRRSGISDREWDTVGFLIRSHLLLSATMNGRDISDPQTTRELAATVGTVERLKMLTLLTYSDISAVNQASMTPWRQQLLWNLYTETDAALTRELGLRIDQPGDPLDPAWESFLTGLPPRYLRTHGRTEIAEHIAMEREAAQRGVAIRLKFETAYALTVVAQDHPFLFASIAGTLSSFGFNILKAEAFSNARGIVVDTFAFADPGRLLELNPEEADGVIATIERAVCRELNVEQLLGRRPITRPDVYAMRGARASFDNGASPSATLIQLTTQDRPGLLFDVASVISRHEGNIEVVLVDTEARKAIDVFYVTRLGGKLSDGEAIKLTEAIKDVIGVR